MQPGVVKFRSFRKLLEFWTIVAENGDKTKKMVYQWRLRLAARLKSGGPSLGRSPGAHKQRQPVNQDQIQIFGEIGSTQFLEQGLPPCSFFRDVLKELSNTKNSQRSRRDGMHQPDPAQF
jgi:hypothetical protein